MTKKAYLAGGCFWGLEDLLRDRPGIVATEAGYTGGNNDDPDYHNHPGHAEALEIEYNPCLLYTSPSPRDRTRSRMPSSA